MHYQAQLFGKLIPGFVKTVLCPENRKDCSLPTSITPNSNPKQWQDGDTKIFGWQIIVIVLFIIFGGGYRFTSYKAVNELKIPNEKILVTIIAEESCFAVIDTALEYSANPERLEFIVANVPFLVETNQTTIRHSCLSGIDIHHSQLIQKYDSNIREIMVDYASPEFAKALIIDEVEAEIYDFILEVESNTVFSHNWDVEIIREWRSIGDRKAILSTHPTRVSDIADREFTHNDGNTMNIICATHFENGHFQTNSPWEIIPPVGDHKPQQIPFYSHLFSFGPASYVIDVPHDINFKFADRMDGLEVLYSGRLTTNGYRLYSPAQDILFHRYEPMPALYEKHKITIESLDMDTKRYIIKEKKWDMQRINLLMGQSERGLKQTKAVERVTADLDIYGWGNRMDRQEWLKRVHIDAAKRESGGDELCKKIRRGQWSIDTAVP